MNYYPILPLIFIKSFVMRLIYIFRKINSINFMKIQFEFVFLCDLVCILVFWIWEVWFLNNLQHIFLSFLLQYKARPCNFDLQSIFEAIYDLQPRKGKKTNTYLNKDALTGTHWLIGLSANDELVWICQSVSQRHTRTIVTQSSPGVPQASPRLVSDCPVDSVNRNM